MTMRALLALVVLTGTTWLVDQRAATTPAPSPKGAAGVPGADRAVPFRVGEKLMYDVGWGSFITAGTATMTVAERRSLADGRTAYYLVAEGKPTSILNALYHVYYKAEALLDTRSLGVVQSTIFSEERGQQHTKITRFLPDGVSIEYELRSPQSQKAVVPVPRFTLDPLSAIYVMRALPLTTGQSLTTPITDQGRTYQMRVNVFKPEALKTALGTLAAWRLTATVTETGSTEPPYKVTAWISTDARRLPLKIEIDGVIGNFALTLAAATGT
jgi:hypothetical protein